MREDPPGDLSGNPSAAPPPADGRRHDVAAAAGSGSESGHSPAVDQATLRLLRRLLTLPAAEVERVRAATRKAPREPQLGPTADYRDD